MNWLKIVWLFVAGTAGDIIHEGKEVVRSMKILLIFSILCPVALHAVGLTLGALGDHYNVDGLVSAGRSFLIVAALIAVVLATWVVIRANVYAFILLAASKAAGAAFEIFPDLETEQVKSVARKLSGCIAWLAGVCVYTQFIPIYRSVGIWLITVTILFGLANMMAAGWFNGKWARISLLVFLLLSLVCTTSYALSSRFARAVSSYGDNVLGPARMTDTDRGLLERLNREREEMRRAAAERNCRGYCSDQLQRVGEIERDIAALQNGTYWSSATSVAPASSPVPPPSVRPGSVTGTAALPPPPVVPRVEPASSSTVGAPPPARRAVPRETFRELDQFPDITGTARVPANQEY